MIETHGDQPAQQPATWRNRDEERRRGPWPAVNHATLTGAAAALAEAHPEIDAVFLFGSYAHGPTHQGSDVDLAVLLRPPPPLEEVVSRQLEVARFCEDRLGLPVDVVLIHPELPAGLLFDIFRIEVILFARDHERPPRCVPLSRRVPGYAGARRAGVRAIAANAILVTGNRAGGALSRLRIRSDWFAIRPMRRLRWSGCWTSSTGSSRCGAPGGSSFRNPPCTL